MRNISNSLHERGALVYYNGYLPQTSGVLLLEPRMHAAKGFLVIEFLGGYGGGMGTSRFAVGGRRDWHGNFLFSEFIIFETGPVYLSVPNGYEPNWCKKLDSVDSVDSVDLGMLHVAIESWCRGLHGEQFRATTDCIAPRWQYRWCWHSGVWSPRSTRVMASRRWHLVSRTVVYCIWCHYYRIASSPR